MDNKEEMVCKYCNATFKREGAYIKHSCEQMKRSELIASLEGQNAYYIYTVWFKIKRRIPPSIETFIGSKFFKQFIDIEKFFRKTKIRKIERFIHLMVDRDFPPSMWMNDSVYSIYIEYLENKIPPMEQVTSSIETLIEYAERNDVSFNNVLTNIEPDKIITWVRSRDLSPWFLLNSKKFKRYYVEKLNGSQRIILENIIRPTFWNKKFLEYEDILKDIRTFIKAVDL